MEGVRRAPGTGLGSLDVSNGVTNMFSEHQPQTFTFKTSLDPTPFPRRE